MSSSGRRRARLFIFIFLHFTDLASAQLVSFPPYIFKSTNRLISSLALSGNSKQSPTFWSRCCAFWSFRSFSNTNFFPRPEKPEVWSHPVITWNGISTFAILLETRSVHLNRVFLFFYEKITRQIVCKIGSLHIHVSVVTIYDYCPIVRLSQLRICT